MSTYVFDFAEGDVSWSPFRIPVARWEAGRVALLEGNAAGADSR